ncbi:hypothetical protein TNCT_159901 [Trichonephila clavata]|uniref:Uncharacterized protein n=1 Tax=Trichonephila clavata TaxID=2740835 RepID=A0A8X6FUA8_TRICU|nr:hypothetical protein TNCT_159901 [Trichonephila clavata]
MRVGNTFNKYCRTSSVRDTVGAVKGEIWDRHKVAWPKLRFLDEDDIWVPVIDIFFEFLDTCFQGLRIPGGYS